MYTHRDTDTRTHIHNHTHNQKTHSHAHAHSLRSLVDTNYTHTQGEEEVKQVPKFAGFLCEHTYADTLSGKNLKGRDAALYVCLLNQFGVHL